MSRLELASKLMSDRLLDDAIVLLTEIIEDEKNLDAYILLIECLLMSGNVVGARNVAKKAIVVAVESKRIDIILKVVEVFAKFELYRDSLRYAKILSRFENSAKFWTLVGNVLFGMGYQDEALSCYNEALRIDPLCVECIINRGILYFTLGKLEEALNEMKKAIEISKDNAEAYYYMAYICHAMNRLEDAVKYYEMAIAHNYNVDEVYWNNLGNAYYNMKKYMESLPYYMMSVLINPRYYIAWNNIGNSLEKLGLYELSILYHDKALSINPRFDYAWYAKAYSLYKLKKHELAYKAALRAIGFNEKSDSAWALLAEILRDLGKLEEAIEAARMAVSLNSSRENLLLLLKLLKEYGRNYVEINKISRLLGEVEEDLYQKVLNDASGLIEIEKYDEAMKVLESIPEEFRNESYYELLAICVLNLERRLCEDLISRLSPKSLVKICFWLLELGMLEEAKKISKDLRKFGEEVPEVYLLLSRIYELEGNQKLSEKYRLIYEGLSYEEIQAG